MKRFDKTLLKNISKELATSNVFPMLREKRMQSFITIGLTLFSLSIFGLFAINPTITTIINLRRQLADDQFVDNQLQEKIANLSTLQQKYSSLQLDLPFVLAAVPPSHQMPQLIGQIRSLASQNNVLIKRIQTNTVVIPAARSQQESSYIFSLTAEGDQDAINHFIMSLVTFERIIGIESLFLNKANNQNGVSNTLDITGKAFFKGE